MSQPLPVAFAAGSLGEWTIESIAPITGETLPTATHLRVVEGPASPGDAAWTLRGVTSNTRYTTAAEADTLRARQEGLGRAAATRAALIPIRKSAAWWAMAQDERRRIFEEQSHHTAIGLEYLPQIARRLHHCRDLGGPFDFLTWFEYAPDASDCLDEMLQRLRNSLEWFYIDREVDIRLSRKAL